MNPIHDEEPVKRQIQPLDYFDISSLRTEYDGWKVTKTREIFSSTLIFLSEAFV